MFVPGSVSFLRFLQFPVQAGAEVVGAFEVVAYVAFGVEVHVLVFAALHAVAEAEDAPGAALVAFAGVAVVAGRGRDIVAVKEFVEDGGLQIQLAFFFGVEVLHQVETGAADEAPVVFGGNG